jgi:peptidoglycan/xylan/chitin deacetylase (PgdA/CDA1 family)
MIENMKNSLSGLLHTRIYWAGALAFAILYAMFTQGGVEDKGTEQTSALTNDKELPIYCVDSTKKVVALSFDAAWGNEDTSAILDILKKNDIKVTFFMTGGWVESFPEDVKKIAEAGHELGNHSENHKNMSKLSVQECKDELMTVHNKVKEITGVDMKVFRPPYGDYDDEVIKTVYECGYYPIQWDVDTLVM